MSYGELYLPPEKPKYNPLNGQFLKGHVPANEAKKVCKHDWRPGQAKGASRINTDHRYMGNRFYFETDGAWTGKISR